MARYALDVLGRVARARKARQEGVPQVVEAQLSPVWERGDAISYLLPLHSPGEVAAIERPAARR